MIKKTGCILYILITFVCSICFAEDNGKKYIVLIADWQSSEVPKEVTNFLKNNPVIKITAILNNTNSSNSDLRVLVDSGVIEPVFAIADEPVFPAIFETKISSPYNVSFAWPEDTLDILARGQSGFKQIWQDKCRGLFLNSGIFSEKLVPDFKKMGINWVTVNENSLDTGAFVKEDFIFLTPYKTTPGSSGKLFETVRISTAQVNVFVFKGKTKVLLNSIFLAGLVKNAKEHPEYEFILPAELLRIESLKNSRNLECDFSYLYERPEIWFVLNKARKAVEDYKNSGAAELKTLGNLKDELFHLYRFSLINDLVKSKDQQNDNLFKAEIENIYRLMGMSVPQELDKLSQGIAFKEDKNSIYNLNSTTNTLSVVNSLSSGNGPYIKYFSVTINENNIKFVVDIDSIPQGVSIKTEVYMDLNNKPMAGITSMLAVPDVFLVPEDAWEFAMSLDNGKASLYRSGSIKPKLIGVYDINNNTIIIPRSTLRGNPLNWGYQAVVYTQPGSKAPWILNDFLCSYDARRQELIQKQSIHIPAVRAKKTGFDE
jgi:hypothetical protein